MSATRLLGALRQSSAWYSLSAPDRALSTTYSTVIALHCHCIALQDITALRFQRLAWSGGTLASVPSNLP